MRILETFFGLLGGIGFLLFVIKFFIHLTLDSRNGYNFKFSVFGALQYYFPYDKNVDSSDEKLKNICNTFYKIAGWGFLSYLTYLIISNVFLMF